MNFRSPSRFSLAACLIVFGLSSGGSSLEFDSAKQYRIVGDAGPASEDWSNGKIEVQQRTYNAKGERELLTLHEVSTEDGKFEIIGEIDEAAIVRIYAVIDDKPVNFAYAVLETGAEISVFHPDDTMGLIADGTGKHATLLSSWQFSEEFQQAVAIYGEALAKKRAEDEAAAANDEGESASDDEVAANTNTDSQETSVDTSSSTEIATNSSDSPSSETDAEVATESESTEEGPDETYKLYQAAKQIEYDALDKIALGGDAELALLAMELGGLRSSEKSITRLDELATLLPEDMAQRRIYPRRAAVQRYLERVAANEALGVGDPAPAFTAPTLDGGELTLASVLQENQVTLVDFWASWCGPCIKTFPDLKELHSEYSDQGFEIVSVSIDDTDEEWLEASEEHELPWINLGDISKGDGPVAMAYGVTFIPKGYILDGNGVIIAKDVSTDDLKALVKKTLSSTETDGQVTLEASSSVVEEPASDQGS